MLSERLGHLAALLDETVALAAGTALSPAGSSPSSGGATVAGQERATLEDYVEARALVGGLASRLAAGGLDPGELERLDLNADLPQFAFHLEEELVAQRVQFEPEVLARSLTFLKRHIVRLRQEYVERRHLLLDPDERAVLTGLALHVRARYRHELAGRYDAIGYRRPYIDKFYRDYSLTGIPDGLVFRLAELAAADRYDHYLCVLKGGMSYTTMLVAFGIPSDRVVHVMAGRASGSHHEDDYLVDPVDFDPADLAGRSVLVVDNNLATGRTLTALTAWLAALGPARVGVLLDYVLSDVAGIEPERLAERIGFAFDEVVCGPFAHRVPAAAGPVAALRAKLMAAVAEVDRPGAGPARTEGAPHAH